MADIWMDLTDAIDASSSIIEMDKKYTNTYLVLQTKDGQEHVVIYKGAHDRFHHFTDVDGVTIRLTQETEHKVICVFPERKLFNSAGMALEFIRLPNRQYRRGICKDNVKIYSPVREMVNRDGHPWNIHTLQDALYATYPQTCVEAIEQLCKQEILSIALSEKFMLSLSIEHGAASRLHLFYMNKLIGYFLKDTFFIKHLMFKQEVFDNISLFKPYRIEF